MYVYASVTNENSELKVLNRTSLLLGQPEWLSTIYSAPMTPEITIIRYWVYMVTDRSDGVLAQSF